MISISKPVIPPGIIKSEQEMACKTVAVDQVYSPVGIPVRCEQLELRYGKKVPGTGFISCNGIGIFIYTLKVLGTTKNAKCEYER